MVGLYNKQLNTRLNITKELECTKNTTRGVCQEQGAGECCTGAVFKGCHAPVNWGDLRARGQSLKRKILLQHCIDEALASFIA